MSESDQHPSSGHPGDSEAGGKAPIPQDVLRRERRVVAGLLAAILLLALGGFVTIPTEEELVHTATTHEDDLTRVRAMNAMVLRGYWKDKAFKDFERFNKAGPHAIRQFMADMHGDMLKPDRRAWTK